MINILKVRVNQAKEMFMMKLDEKTVATVCGHDIKQFTLINDHQTRVDILSWGASLQHFIVNENGNEQSLIISYPTVEEYLSDHWKLCKAVGPVAGRIDKAAFDINGHHYQLRPNENDNLLHSGSHGFSDINWDGHININDDKMEVVLNHHFDPYDIGFPGHVDVTMTYCLDNDDRLLIKWRVVSDQATLFNPTVHTYFNIGDQTNLDGQKLQINSQYRTALRDDKIPTGALVDVTNTPFDFRQGVYLDDALQKLHDQTTQIPFDDAFQVTPSLIKPIATLSTAERRVKIYSDRNGLVVFTANPLDAHEQVQHHFNAVALEAQTLPDAIHHDGFGNIILSAYHAYQCHIIYQYEKL